MLRVTQLALAVPVLGATTSFVTSLMHQFSLHINDTICSTCSWGLLDMASPREPFLHHDLL